MPTTATPTVMPAKTPLDRALSLFTEVRAGEGATAVLMLVNVFLLLTCYAVIKTVREPLILLGGGAEVRSYAAAAQALLLMGFVPAYAWFASRVGRLKLLVGVTLFFVACIELFAMAVAAHVPMVGVAFFVWVGIFNISLVAQFWSFANDLYSKDAGRRLFPFILVGMTAGAPLGSLVAGRLFRLGIQPQLILQVAAMLLCVSVALYFWINRRTGPVAAADRPLESSGGFRLVLASAELRLIAVLVVLLNVVNTTGEYLVARSLWSHVASLALADPSFDAQAYIGAFSGNYQFWVNVVAFLLQAFVASRLVKRTGLAGVLLALPIIALGGYALIAAGASFAAIRWVKTAENATDYSIMNTARQMLWLPMTREEKYKAKQAIDTFFVRAGDVLSASVVYIGTRVIQLTPQQFAVANIALVLVWIVVALRILHPQWNVPRRLAMRPLSAGAAAMVALVLMTAQPALGQTTRQEQLAAERAEKATQLRPYEMNAVEKRIALVDRVIANDQPVYLAIGSGFDGGGLAFGPGYRARYGDTGAIDARASWSLRNYRSADATLTLPALAREHVVLDVHGRWIDAPRVAFFGVGARSDRDDRSDFALRSASAGIRGTVTIGKLAFGTNLEAVRARARASLVAVPATIEPAYRRAAVSAQLDTRSAPDYSRSGGLYRVEWADFHPTDAATSRFSRVDMEVQRFVPVMRERWVLAFRALASTTETGQGQDVPYFMLPELGGSKTLRGYSSWRFRDRNRLLLSGEYRWMAGPLIDMALFVDAGKVTAHRADLNLNDLAVTHGIGVRVHSPGATVARFEVARSREGTSLVVAFGPSF